MSTLKKSLNVAVVGLGPMGAILARNIAFKARSAIYLQLYSSIAARSRELSDTLWKDGAQCSMRLHTRRDTVAKWSDVIIVSLGNADACREVYLDTSDGLLSHIREGQIIVDHTTLDYDSTREFHEIATQRGAKYIDAPMSGNVTAARNGSLTIMAGGDESAFLKVLPLLRLYGESIQHMGDPGAGTAAKMICQQLVAIHTVAAAEAMTLAHNLGIDNHKKLISALDASWGSSTMLRRNAPLAERMLRNPQEAPPDSRNTIFSLVRDLDRVAEANSALPLTSLAHDVLRKAEAAGAGSADMAAAVHYLDAAAYPGKAASSMFGSPVMMSDEAVPTASHNDFSSDGSVMTGQKKKKGLKKKRRVPTILSANERKIKKEQEVPKSAVDETPVEAY
eukprot:PhM_4_TR17782/c0_g1_i1/m.103777/K00020/mmsB, HIBADH; 3-hydroxyisobutyrate dehydrogenase